MRDRTKVVRDLWATRGRMAFMVLALAAGLTSMGTVLSMRSVVQREMTRSYLDSVPASATFDVGERGVPDSVLAALRDRPEVAWAERRATREGRGRHPAGDDWGRAMIFVIEDFADQRLALLEHDSGDRNPPIGTVLVERSAMLVLGASVGDRIELTVPAGRVVDIEIAGVVHEPALAPAITEQAGYFYATAETLELLGPRPVLDELRVLVDRDALEVDAVQAQVEAIAAWLVGTGVDVHQISVPPPGEHPHQRPSEAVLLLFAIFSGLTVALACVLTASLLSFTMARQVRQVGVMKTIGATAARIRWMYVAMLGLVSLVALLISAIPTWALGRLGIDAVAGLLNLDIASYAVPGWVIGAQIATAFALPVVTAAPAIIRASRISVREALVEHGVREPNATAVRMVGVVRDRLTRVALLNALRVRRRLLLTVGLLAIGGGLFVTAVSVADSWDAMTEQVYETRHYDVELHLAEPVAASVLDDLDGVDRVEIWGTAPVTVASESGFAISRTYPDGGHGSFSLVGAPEHTELVDFSLRSGRWLRPGDRDAVVLNQLAASRLGSNPVGRSVTLVVEGRTASWQVVGVVEEVAAPATAYVSAADFVDRTGQQLGVLRIATGTNRDPMATRAAVRDIGRQLTGRDVRIAKTVPLELLYNAMGEHVVVLIRSLLGLALLMAIVGGLALGSNMSTSVVERTSEIGVLRAIGARPSQVRSMILVEAWFVTLLSLPAALLVAIPLSALVGRVVGQLSFELSLPLDISWTAMAGWSVGVLVVSTLAALVPARGAMKLSVTEALTRV